VNFGHGQDCIGLFDHSLPLLGARRRDSQNNPRRINILGNILGRHQLDPLKIRQRLIRLNAETGFGSGYDNLVNDIGHFGSGRIELQLQKFETTSLGVHQEDDDLYGFTDGSLGAATHYGPTDGATDGDCTGGGAVVVSNRILGLDFLVFGFSFVDEALEAEQPFVLFGTCVVSCCHVDISGIFKMWWMTSR